MCVSPRVCSVGVYSEPQGNASKSKSRVQIFMHRGRGGCSYQYHSPIIMDLPSQFFSEKRNTPNSIYTRAGEAQAGGDENHTDSFVGFGAVPAFCAAASFSIFALSSRKS